MSDLSFLDDSDQAATPRTTGRKAAGHPKSEDKTILILSCAITGFACFVTGFFAGREYLKWEARCAMEAAANAMKGTMETVTKNMKASIAQPDIVDKSKELLAKVKAKPDLVVQSAVTQLRKNAARTFGSDQAKVAKILVKPGQPKEFGDAWKVSGVYSGKNQDDKEFIADWTATVLVQFDELQSTIQMMPRIAKSVKEEEASTENTE